MAEAMMREGAVTAGGKGLKPVGVVERRIGVGVEVVGVGDIVGVMRDVVIKWVEVSVGMMLDEGMTSGAGVLSVC